MTVLERFGEYELVESMGSGTVCDVFLAKHGTRPPVVLKRLKKYLLEDPEVSALFSREIEIVRTLRHENIVRIIDVGAVGDVPFYTMERVEGVMVSDLFTQLRAHHIDHQQLAYFVVADVALGLDHAHFAQGPFGALQVVHRDITPENLIVDSRGFTKILDFGLAKSTSSAAVTQVGMVRGRFQFLSPELFRGAKPSHQSDLYSLGVCLYQMLTGSNPFPDASLHTLMSAEPRVAPRVSQSVSISAGVDDYVASLLAIDVDQRPKRGLDVATFLRGQSELKRSRVSESVALAKQYVLLPDEQSDTALSLNAPTPSSGSLRPNPRPMPDLAQIPTPVAFSPTEQEPRVAYAMPPPSTLSPEVVQALQPKGLSVDEGSLERALEEELDREVEQVLEEELNRALDESPVAAPEQAMEEATEMVAAPEMDSGMGAEEDATTERVERPHDLIPENVESDFFDTVSDSDDDDEDSDFFMVAHRRRSRRRLLVAGLVLLFMVALGAFFFLRTNDAVPSAKVETTSVNEPKKIEDIPTSLLEKRRKEGNQASAESAREADAEEALAKEALAKEALAKEALAKEALAKEALAKEALAKEAAAQNRASQAAKKKQTSTRKIRLRAPNRVVWRHGRKRVARGSETVVLGKDAKTLIAYDTERQTTTSLPVRSVIDFDSIPKGTLQVRVFPYADVYDGKIKLGTTPFKKQSVLSGTHRLRLEYNGQVKKKTVTIRAGETTTVKVRFDP